MPEPFPLEFSRDLIALARRFEAPMSQIAKDFGISESCLHRWLKLGDVEEGLRPGITQAEAEEMRELKKSNLKGNSDHARDLRIYESVGAQAKHRTPLHELA